VILRIRKNIPEKKSIGKIGKMKTYQKIQTLFLRSENAGRSCTVVPGKWSRPEFKLLKDIDWVMTEKVDGTNIRVIWDSEKVVFKGKNKNSQIPSDLVQKLMETFIPEKMASVFPAKEGEEPIFTLYGEGYGREIQKGGGDYIPDGVDFILFDVYFSGTEGGMWLTREACEVIAKTLDIKIVPIIDIGPLSVAISHCINGFKSELRYTPPEGLILKPLYELKDRRGNRIISKLKLSDF